MLALFLVVPLACLSDAACYQPTRLAVPSLTVDAVHSASIAYMHQLVRHWHPGGCRAHLLPFWPEGPSCGNGHSMLFFFGGRQCCQGVHASGAVRHGRRHQHDAAALHHPHVPEGRHADQ